MRHAALLLGLALGTSACKKDEPAAAAGPTPTPAAEDAGDAQASGGSSEVTSDSEEPTDGTTADDSKSGEGKGLLGLTRDMIDEARYVAAEPHRLVPDVAQFVVQVTPATLLGHSELRALWDQAERSDDDFSRAMDVVRACLGRVEAIDQIVLGFDPDDHLVLVAKAKGLGTAATWECFAREASARGESLDLEITRTPRGKGPQLRESDEDPAKADLGYFPDDDTAVMISRDWDDELRAVMDGSAKPALEGRLTGPAGRLKLDRPMWLVGAIQGSVAADLPPQLSDIQDVAFSLDIEDESLVTHTSTHAGTAANATRVRNELQTSFDGVESMLVSVGLPSTLGPKIEFVAEGDLVSLDFTLARTELQAIRRSIEGTMGTL